MIGHRCIVLKNNILIILKFFVVVSMTKRMSK
jgi:hypothetical protein